MLTPEQESYREEIANRFGAAHVIPLPGHSSVAICGWVGSPETGWRADGAEWEWLHADGQHGPVDPPAHREVKRWSSDDIWRVIEVAGDPPEGFPMPAAGDFLGERQFWVLAEDFDAATARQPLAQTECARVLAEPCPCGRLLVGQGGDTWDPICTQPSGHEGRCQP